MTSATVQVADTPITVTVEDTQIAVSVSGPAGPAGPTGPTGAPGTAAAWATVTLWADLPMSGNVLGQKIRVTSGLGLCVALWNGTAWTIAPESATPRYTKALSNGWAGNLTMWRTGTDLHIRCNYVSGDAATNDIMCTLAATWTHDLAGWVNAVVNGPQFAAVNFNDYGAGAVACPRTSITGRFLVSDLRLIAPATWPTTAP